MLREESAYYEMRMMTVMSDIAIIAGSIKTTLLEIAKQSSALGTGLQNAAPGTKGLAANKSVQYLLETFESLAKKAEECEEFLSSH
jgi:hypothetical protein